MRIISGTHKGRHIPILKNFPSRPTTDFAKENIFNIISNHFNFEDTAALDLFSGTGSISYEFSSRGCREIISVEKDFRSVKFINKTIHDAGLDNIRVVKYDVFKFIEKCTQTFDIIFADPPYDLNNISFIPELVFERKILNKNGWLILEHGKNQQFNDNQHLINTRSYGSINFSIFENK